MSEKWMARSDFSMLSFHQHATLSCLFFFQSNEDKINPGKVVDNKLTRTSEAPLLSRVLPWFLASGFRVLIFQTIKATDTKTKMICLMEARRPRARRAHAAVQCGESEYQCIHIVHESWSKLQTRHSSRLRE